MVNMLEPIIFEISLVSLINSFISLDFSDNSLSSKANQYLASFADFRAI